jgi:hypothetical protein
MELFDENKPEGENLVTPSLHKTGYHFQYFLVRAW